VNRILSNSVPIPPRPNPLAPFPPREGGETPLPDAGGAGGALTWLLVLGWVRRNSPPRVGEGLGERSHDHP
jgi:hypothetical protein